VVAGFAVILLFCVHRRSGSGSSDIFGPAVTPAAAATHQQQQQPSGRSSAGGIAMQPLPVSGPAAHQQQQQLHVAVPGSPSAAGVRARLSRLGQQQQQQQQQGTSSSSGGGGSGSGRTQQFTLGGDDTL